MKWPVIRKRPEDYAGANLLDYGQAVSAFSWDAARLLLDGLPDGGLNIAHEALDIDSIDFLNFISAIHRRLGVSIPEIDYPKLATLAGAISYVQSRLG